MDMVKRVIVIAACFVAFGNLVSWAQPVPLVSENCGASGLIWDGFKFTPCVKPSSADTQSAVPAPSPAPPPPATTVECKKHGKSPALAVQFGKQAVLYCFPCLHEVWEKAGVYFEIREVGNRGGEKEEK